MRSRSSAWPRSTRSMRAPSRPVVRTIRLQISTPVPMIAHTSGSFGLLLVWSLDWVAQPASWYLTIRSRKPRAWRSRDRYTRHFVEHVTAWLRFPHNGASAHNTVAHPERWHLVSGEHDVELAPVAVPGWTSSTAAGGRDLRTALLAARHQVLQVGYRDLRRRDESVTEVSTNVTLFCLGLRRGGPRRHRGRGTGGGVRRARAQSAKPGEGFSAARVCAGVGPAGFAGPTSAPPWSDRHGRGIPPSGAPGSPALRPSGGSACGGLPPSAGARRTRFFVS